ncbi:polygalacturonase-like [Mangifera indica]|uniref:polygalacturonase-like n=1 Tax=Mangifera indica TaxID=29780 RepID=UPI001CF93DC8|nr:polygalacturonase-like [Mangifera indica]
MAKPMGSFIFLVLLLVLFFDSSIAISVSYNVVSLGAKPDGVTDSSKAFLDAWTKACGSTVAAKIYVPEGRFLLGNTVFEGECKNNDITIRIDGTLVAPVYYNALRNADYWLLFHRVDGVWISGGTFDGQGAGLWACKKTGKSCPIGATTLKFINSKNSGIYGLKSINSQKFHILIHKCDNVKVQGVTISAPWDSPNTDGIHVELSNNVAIMNSNIGTGDDCVSVGRGTNNLWVKGIACGPGHGISIGSLGKEQNEAGVQNVTVETVKFTRTDNGLRIKTWAKPSSSFVSNILFRNVTMNNVKNPIIIDQNYCPHKKNCPDQVSGVKISDVTYRDIFGTSATEVGVKFNCSSHNPCSGITLEDLKLTYKNQPAKASCSHVVGSARGFDLPNTCFGKQNML